jgi:Leucine-rich repeat (LRR) protein
MNGFSKKPAEDAPDSTEPIDTPVVTGEETPDELDGFITIAGVEILLRETRVELSGKELTSGDIKEISRLKNLEKLILDDNKIDDLSEIGKLTNLTLLSLMNNEVANLSPLSNLKELQWLDLDGNNISDLTPLSGLTEIQRLFLKDNQITDASPITSMNKLEWLVLKGNKISDYSVLYAFEYSIRYFDG